MYVYDKKMYNENGTYFFNDQKNTNDMINKNNYKNSKNIAIIGFPSMGLVGAFAVSYLVDYLKMKRVGELKFTKPTPIYAVQKGKIYGPVQVFKKDKTFAIISTIPLDLLSAYEVTKAIIQFTKKNSIDEIIIPRGINMKLPECKVLGLVTNEKSRKLLQKYKLDELSDSTIFGTDAGIISAMQEYSGDALLIYITCGIRLPDPNATVTAIQKLGNLLGIKPDIKEIRDRLEQIRKENKRLIEETKRALEKDMMQKTRAPGIG